MQLDMPDLLIAYGGAPESPPDQAEGESEKAAARRRKREARLVRDAHRPPDSFERFKILMEVLSEGRQVVELADHKARYALVIIGVLNTGVFYLLARLDLLEAFPPSLQPWMKGLLILYAVLTCVFVFHAIDALRPRRMKYEALVGGAGGPLGVMYWETIAAQDVETYRREWAGAQMGQINAELVLVAHRLARLIQVKYAALGKLYAGLVVLVLMATALLATAAFVAL